MPNIKTLLFPLLSLLFTLHFTFILADTSTTIPTTWFWRTGAPSVISHQVEVHPSYRILNLQLISTTPYILTALFVRNKPPYSTWYWYYNLDPSQLSDKLSTLNARITDLEPYTISSKTYFAVVLHGNTRDDAKHWWYYYDASPALITEKLHKHNARLVDLDVYNVADSTRYSAAMIRNTGDDARSWWWYHKVSPAFITKRLRQNRARLTHIERNAPDKYSVIMEKASATGWYYYAQSSSALLQKAAQNGARVVHVEPYFDNGVQRYAAILLSNVNELTRRVYDVLAPARSEGAFGLYMKEIRGPVRAALQHKYVYEPASSIKALHLAHAMRIVQNGADDLDDDVSYFNDLSGSCPQNSGVVRERLEKVLERMMRASSNTATQGIRARYGQRAINLSAKQLGMTNSKIRHRIGCAISSTGITGQIDEPNSLTLVDITRLYERVATSFLSGTHRAKFFNIMSPLKAVSPIVMQEARKLPKLTTEQSDQFMSLMYSRHKGGSYNVNGKYYKSIGAYVRLPIRSCSGDLSFKEYALGAFIEQSSRSVKPGLIHRAGAETMRDEIRKALFSFQPCLSVVIRFDEDSQ